MLIQKLLAALVPNLSASQWQMVGGATAAALAAVGTVDGLLPVVKVVIVAAVAALGYLNLGSFAKAAG